MNRHKEIEENLRAARRNLNVAIFFVGIAVLLQLYRLFLAFFPGGSV